MFKFIASPLFKKGISIASAVATGVISVVTALADQKKAREFEELKKAVSELQNK